MNDEMTPLSDVLERLPWFGDLTFEHRTQMLAEVAARLDDGSRDEFTALLARWAAVSYEDIKWARLELLRQSGLLNPPKAA